MKIVVLDGYTLNPGDNSWSEIETLGELVVYDRALSAEDVAAHFAAIPEPSTLVLCVLGVMLVLAARRR